MTKSGIWLSRAAIGAVLVCGGCGGERDGVAKTEPLVVRLFYTCDTHGYLFPCDCDSGREGGLARRQTHLSDHAAEVQLLVDAGDVTAGRREWEVLEYEYLLRGCELMGYDAVNLGHREAGLSAGQLRDFAARFPFLVSANLLGDDGRPLAAPFRIRALPNGHRVALLGVMDDRVRAEELGKGGRVIPPDEAVGKYLPELEKSADSVFLLAFADERTMIDLANLFYEISLIVGGDVVQSSPEPVRMNQSAIVYVTDKGKSIGQLDLWLADGKWQALTNDVIALTDDVPDAPEVGPLLAEYRRTLSNRQFRTAGQLRDDSEGLSAIGAVEEEGEDEKAAKLKH